VWGSTLIVVAVLGLRVIPAGVRAYNRLHTQREEQLTMLARGRDVLARAGETRRALGEAASALVATAPKLLGGTTEGEAAGALQAALSLAAARHGLQLVTANQQAVGGPTPELFVPVRVRAQLEGRVAALVAFLAEVEAGAQVLSVRELTVERLGRTQSPSTGERLRVTIAIDGWRLQRGST
jgi:hypothetical protein